MMRALWAGVSGLKNHQTRMDVIGNNIANVNTVGFKASRVTFQDMLSQSIQGAGSPAGNLGGTNPMQVGMGMSLASIDTIFTDGAPQATGNQYDLAISGRGFFQVSKDGGVTKEYTRDGAFDFDSAGNYIIPNTGYKVMGYTLDASGKPVGAAGPITISKTDLMPAKVSTSLAFTGNLSASSTAAGAGALGVAGSAAEINLARNASIAASGALAAATAAPGATAATILLAVQNAVAAVPGWAASATQTAYTNANIAGATGASIATAMSTNLTTQIKAGNVSSDDSISFKVYSTSGNAYNLNGTIEKTGPNTWSFTPTSTITDSTGATIANVTETAGPMVITFTASGTFVNSTPGYKMTVTPVVAPATAAGPAAFTVTPDFSTLTQSDSTSTAMASGTDGYAAGTLNKLSINSSGKFSATYSNGVTKDLAQVAMFTFNNPGGLEKSGGNMYTESNNSGLATKDQSSTVNPGNLEMSNVDLAQQFSDMIVTQRGFQANSKIITTTDTMLEELVNLKR